VSGCQGRVFHRDIEVEGRLGVVVDDEKFFVGRFAQESVVVVVPSDVPLFASAQGGVILAEGEQRLDVGEDVLLFGSASGGGEGVSGIAGKASGKVAAVVGIVATGKSNLVTGINLGNSAEG